MMITVTRYLRAADGSWDPMEPIKLHMPPEEAVAYARRRDTGPIAPLDDEIIQGCEDKYRRVKLAGFANPGDIDVAVTISRGAGG